MHILNVRRFGLAAGAASVALYLGCMIAMAILPDEILVRFFNALFHGLDVSPILRENVPAGDALIGIAGWFVIGAILGALFAGIYNLRAAGSD